MSSTPANLPGHQRLQAPLSKRFRTQTRRLAWLICGVLPRPASLGSDTGGKDLKMPLAMLYDGRDDLLGLSALVRNVPLQALQAVNIIAAIDQLSGHVNASGLIRFQQSSESFTEGVFVPMKPGRWDR